jgi:hypothetical protein
MVQDAGNHATPITSRLSRFRAALERNKIIFETLAAFSLSAMAVIVALAQYQTTSKQTKLIALQTQIAEARRFHSLKSQLDKSSMTKPENTTTIILSWRTTEEPCMNLPPKRHTFSM